MIQSFQHFNLRSYNTFGINANANLLVVIDTIEELTDFIINHPKNLPLLVLGGGSNILFTRDFQGVIVKPAIEGYRLVKETEQHVYIEVGAGVEWDEFVSWTVENGWGGLENLSLIPGRVGACPIQNIGAYGVEVKDVIENVEGVYIEDGSKFSFSNKECNFDYRFSIFKSDLKNKCIILKVTFRLNKKPSFVLNYGSLEEEVASLGGINLENIRKAVIKVRQSKLPDHHVIGNAGSFFKNPFVDREKSLELKKLFPNIPLFENSSNMLKTSAAFLIDKAGWKGVRKGDAGVHEKQPLVLVNHGKANGMEIASLAKEIQADVLDKFGIELEMEVNFI